MSWSQGQLFYERFRLEQILGRGGFSEVWKANDEKARAVVAIKIFIKQDEEGVQLCRQEYQKAHNLNHPNVLRPTYFDVYNGAPFLVMPYCSQGTVAAKIGTLPPERVIQLFRELASALNYIHTRTNSISHNDIKPDNILIDEEGHFMLTDFGISQRFQQKLTRTVNSAQKEAEAIKSGVTALAYRAPELFSYKGQTQKPASNATDIWAFGTLLFQVSTGQLPFHGEGGLAQLIGMSDGQTAVSDLVAPLPGFLAPNQKQLIFNCLELETWKRPSAQLILNTLDNAQPAQAQRSAHPGATSPSKGKIFLEQYGLHALIAIVVFLLGLSIWAIAGGGGKRYPTPPNTIPADTTNRISGAQSHSSRLAFEVPADTLMFGEDDGYWDDFKEESATANGQPARPATSPVAQPKVRAPNSQKQDAKTQEDLVDAIDTASNPPKLTTSPAPPADITSPQQPDQQTHSKKPKLTRAVADQILGKSMALSVTAGSGINTVNSEQFVRQPIVFRVENQIVEDRVVIVPSGSTLNGVVTRASSGKFLAPAQIQIEFESLTVNGQPLSIKGAEILKKGRGGEKDIFILNQDNFSISIQPSRHPSLKEYIYSLVEY